MKETTKKTSNQIISDFLNSNKNVLFTVLAVIVVIIIAFGIITSINNNKNNLMINSTTELDRLFDEASQGESIDEFIQYADSLTVDFKSTKAELMAYSRLASYYFDNEDFDKAYNYYNLAYTLFPKDMAASLYLFNSAMAKEELGDVDEAISILENLVVLYKSSVLDVADRSADVPEAIFNLGRLYESKNDIDNAVLNYEILVAEYQSYNLSSLAKTRLLTIK